MKYLNIILVNNIDTKITVRLTIFSKKKKLDKNFFNLNNWREG